MLISNRRRGVIYYVISYVRHEVGYQFRGRDISHNFSVYLLRTQRTTLCHLKSLTPLLSARTIENKKWKVLYSIWMFPSWIYLGRKGVTIPRQQMKVHKYLALVFNDYLVFSFWSLEVIIRKNILPSLKDLSVTPKMIQYAKIENFKWVLTDS